MGCQMETRRIGGIVRTDETRACSREAAPNRSYSNQTEDPPSEPSAIALNTTTSSTRSFRVEADMGRRTYLTILSPMNPVYLSVSNSLLLDDLLKPFRAVKGVWIRTFRRAVEEMTCVYLLTISDLVKDCIRCLYLFLHPTIRHSHTPRRQLADRVRHHAHTLHLDLLPITPHACHLN